MNIDVSTDDPIDVFGKVSDKRRQIVIEGGDVRFIADISRTVT